MGVCGWSILPAFALPSLPAARAVPMARECDQKAAPGERPAASIGRRCRSPPTGATGVEGFIDVPASSSFATNAWRSSWSLAGSASATPVVLHASFPAERAHTRLSWQERLARNARVSTSEQVTIRLFGVPEAVATSLGLATT